jgi:hypothetical protein
MSKRHVFIPDTALGTLGLGAWAAFLLHATNAGVFMALHDFLDIAK